MFRVLYILGKSFVRSLVFVKRSGGARNAVVSRNQLLNPVAFKRSRKARNFSTNALSQFADSHIKYFVSDCQTKQIIYLTPHEGNYC